MLAAKSIFMLPTILLNVVIIVVVILFVIKMIKFFNNN